MVYGYVSCDATTAYDHVCATAACAECHVEESFDIGSSNPLACVEPHGTYLVCGADAILYYRRCDGAEPDAPLGAEWCQVHDLCDSSYSYGSYSYSYDDEGCALTEHHFYNCDDDGTLRVGACGTDATCGRCSPQWAAPNATCPEDAAIREASPTCDGGLLVWRDCARGTGEAFPEGLCLLDSCAGDATYEPPPPTGSSKKKSGGVSSQVTIIVVCVVVGAALLGLLLVSRRHNILLGHSSSSASLDPTTPCPASSSSKTGDLEFVVTEATTTPLGTASKEEAKASERSPMII